MKKLLALSVFLSLALLLTACYHVVRIPDIDPSDENSIGKPKTFESDGITLLLTDQFREQESQVGFDAYYVADFAGVMVLKEEFTLEEGLGEKTLENYTNGVIENNGHQNTQAQEKDGLWYYIKDTDTVRYYSFSYKGSDAFYIVQYSCFLSQTDEMEDTIFQWAKAVEVE